MEDLKITFGFSVLPTLNSTLVFGGYKLQNGVYFAPIILKLGLILSIGTYENKLNLGVKADTVSSTSKMEILKKNFFLGYNVDRLRFENVTSRYGGHHEKLKRSLQILKLLQSNAV